MRFNRKVVEVNAAKNNPSVGRSWHQPNVPVSTSVESDALDSRRTLNSSLKHLYIRYHDVAEGFPTFFLAINNL